MPNALNRLGYLAGDDKRRAADLNAAFADRDMRAVFCVRGGYGATRILDRLDYGPLADDPKPILGYSDITAVLAAVWHEAGLVGFHGPMVATSERLAMGSAMRRLQRELVIETSLPPALPSVEGEFPHVLKEGRAEGRLVGGNLSLVCALIGTPWQIDTTGQILFLEDVDEDPYRVDRMLTQLRQAGFLMRAAGLVLGDFHVEDTPVASAHPDMARVLADCTADVRGPVIHGCPFGHRPRSWTIPFGVRARLDAPDEKAVPRLTLLEPAVS
jgi:muramoyltetrapeptide carboxypeptidase